MDCEIVPETLVSARTVDGTDAKMKRTSRMAAVTSRALAFVAERGPAVLRPSRVASLTSARLAPGLRTVPEELAPFIDLQSEATRKSAALCISSPTPSSR